MINVNSLKTLPPEAVLPALSLEYKHVGGNIFTQARDERTASLSIHQAGGVWLWKDFGGADKGGSWIDLVMFVRQCSYIESIKFLNRLSGQDFSFSRPYPTLKNQEQATKKKNPTVEIKLISVISGITDISLLGYLNSRRILSFPEWLMEITYLVKKDGKEYANKAVGIKNEKGGYAVRNSRVKMNIGPTAFSYIKNSGTQILITEGLFDALTFNQINDLKSTATDIIILNSTNNLSEKVFEILAGYEKIICALDNDAVGKETAGKIIGRLKEKNIQDVSEMYSEFKDINEFFCNK
jgi:5S rRNA maturation endonuclease (ribonuclease M5)